MLEIIKGTSHVDHNLSENILEFIKKRFEGRAAFFIETFELPEGLGTVPCGIHGPIEGDDPVPDSECFFQRRGDRRGESRMCNRPMRVGRTVTVIAGPHADKACVLYTAFGGKLAPREPWDPGLKDSEKEESKVFWSQHALSVGA